MPVIPRENWGRPLSEFIDDSDSEDDDEGSQLLESVGANGLIEHLKTIELIPLSTLQAICQLAWTPADLRVFNDSNITPSLMKALRSYCRRKQIFDYEYGYFWMEALTLAVRVSVLLKTDNLEKFIENQSKSVSLVEQASGCIVDALPGQGPGMSRIFGCSALDNTCLPLKNIV
ncbi:hypothetical protein BDV93DRAFT_612432 [Ceratobasidium sp. AG-I]|nr:hypothetical protein BDV93DRAFT_612432 [Ceratobasidium sp. AG-I]